MKQIWKWLFQNWVKKNNIRTKQDETRKANKWKEVDPLWLCAINYGKLTFYHAISAKCDSNRLQLGLCVACTQQKSKEAEGQEKRLVNIVCLLHRQHLLLFHFIRISLWGDFSEMENIDYDCDSSGLYKMFLKFFSWTQMLSKRSIYSKYKIKWEDLSKLI